MSSRKPMERVQQLNDRNTTVRERQRCNSRLNTLVRINKQLQRDADLPMPPTGPEADAAAALKAATTGRGGGANAASDDAATSAGESAAASAGQSPRPLVGALEAARQIYATPQSRGQHEARQWLDSVRTGELSLADAEVMNNQCGLTSGADYPSYYTKCDENINGVRVADWVLELVPPERLPHGEDVWLPIYHCLKDWDSAGRRIEPHPTHVHVNDDPSGFHFGAKAPTSGRGDGAS